MDLKTVADSALIARLQELVGREREDLAEVVAHLEEVDRRELLIAYGYPSLYLYCVSELRYSEAGAYARIRAARACRRLPQILEMLRRGELHLDALVRLSPHLGGADAADLLDRAKGKTSQEVSAFLAELFPGRELPDMIRPVGNRPVAPVEPDHSPLFAAAGTAAGTSPETADTVAGAILAPSPAPEGGIVARVRFAFTADEELVLLVRRARELLRHKYSDGRLERIFKDALLALLEKRDPDRRLLAVLPRPARGRVRRIPRWVKNTVWRRDRGRCAYFPQGRRACGSKDGLEFDHIKPWALGGDSDAPANIRLLCRTHNRHLARGIMEGLRPAEEDAPSSPFPAGS